MPTMAPAQEGTALTGAPTDLVGATEASRIVGYDQPSSWYNAYGQNPEALPPASTDPLRWTRAVVEAYAAEHPGTRRGEPRATGTYTDDDGNEYIGANEFARILGLAAHHGIYFRVKRGTIPAPDLERPYRWLRTTATVYAAQQAGYADTTKWVDAAAAAAIAGCSPTVWLQRSNAGETPKAHQHGPRKVWARTAVQAYADRAAAAAETYVNATEAAAILGFTRQYWASICAKAAAKALPAGHPAPPRATTRNGKRVWQRSAVADYKVAYAAYRAGKDSTAA